MEIIKLCRTCRRPLKIKNSRFVWIVSLMMNQSDILMGVFDTEAAAIAYADKHHDEGDVGSVVVKMIVNQPKEYVVKGDGGGQ